MRAGSALLSSERILDFAGLEEGQTVLEIGPGRTGHTLFPAAERVGVQGRVIALDIAREILDMLEGLRRQYLVHQVDFLWMDIEGEYEVPVTNVDVVLMVNTAWMLKRHAEIFTRLAKTLAPEGRLVVVDWVHERGHALAPRWDFCINPERLDVVLAHAGLRAVERAQISRWHWGRMYRPF